MKMEILKHINDILEIDITKKTKRRNYVLGRVVFAEMCRRMGLTYTEIGKILDCHYSTVIYLTKQFEDTHDLYDDVRELMEKVTLKFNPHPVLSEIQYTYAQISSLQKKLKKLKLKL